MRRRTKPRVVWLPPDPNNRMVLDGASLTSADQTAIGYHEFHITGAKNPGDYDGVAFAVVGDLGNAEQAIIGASAESPSFSDLYNSGYRLRRICGSFFGCLSQDNDNAGGVQGSVILTAGFQVMRVDTSGIPVDTAAAAPDIYENQDNPWIWRRSWALTNFASTTGVRVPMGLSNTYTGSVKEGSFVDQKTARVVGVDQRLFMCVTVTQQFAQQVGLDTFVSIAWNLRVLGSLKTNLGNRRNASR